MSGFNLSPENQKWLDAFIAAHGNAPRVLHIGNIANNAYKNARLLNEVGLDCDVICYDYYHLMGCPEWEEVDFEHPIDDQFRPDWKSLPLCGYERPKWFAQGPLQDCIRYLVARRCKHTVRANHYWNGLTVANQTINRRSLWARLLTSLRAFIDAAARGVGVMMYEPKIITRLARSCEEGSIAGRVQSTTGRIAVMIALLLAIPPLRVLSLLLVVLRKQSFNFDRRVAELVEQFIERFPLRADKLSPNDVEMYRQSASAWNSLLKHYDLVQAYATDPIIPAICDYRPFIGFEHGTLRDFTLGDSQVCRLTSLAYSLADHVFITNGDCIEFARRINLERFSPMLHPIEVDGAPRIDRDYSDLHERLGVKQAFFCPLRHDWKIKGTDVYLRALPALVGLLGRRFKIIMTKWGAQVDQSMLLAGSLGCADLIHWIEPLPRKALLRMQKSVDVVFDQIALPHFGATAPEALACGVPVIMSYDPASTRWIIPEPAPILTAWTPEDVVAQVKLALDPEWRVEFRKKAERWIKQYHSLDTAINLHVDVYRRLLPV